MKLVVGLGNVGHEYIGTRHNVGFVAIDTIAPKITNYQLPITNQNYKFQLDKRFKCELLKLENVILAKPTTFVNKSGDAVSLLTSYYKISPSDLYVIHDDLDIRIGEYKVQFGKGPKVHNGVNSVENSMGTKDFWRIRIGVENPESRIQDQESKVPGKSYVLMKFNDIEQVQINSVSESICKDLLIALK